LNGLDTWLGVLTWFIYDSCLVHKWFMYF